MNHMDKVFFKIIFNSHFLKASILSRNLIWLLKKIKIRKNIHLYTTDIVWLTKWCLLRSNATDQRFLDKFTAITTSKECSVSEWILTARSTWNRAESCSHCRPPWSRRPWTSGGASSTSPGTAVKKQ